jgi:hypothetical protein
MVSPSFAAMALATEGMDPLIFSPIMITYYLLIPVGSVYKGIAHRSTSTLALVTSYRSQHIHYPEKDNKGEL